MKTVVITGAASGLGKALANLFASKGYQVVVADIDEVAGQEVTSQLSTITTAHFHRCDVSDKDSLQELAQFVDTTCGSCHVLINNAGIASSGNLMQTDDDEWQRLITINLMSCINSSMSFMGLLKSTATEQSPATIVNIASLAAFGLLGGMMSYNVSKAAVVAFSESLRCELARDHIHVVAACPSFFKTNLTSSMTTSDADTIARVERWMEKSALTADSVAEDIYQGIGDKEILIFSDKHVRRLYKIYTFIYNLMVPKSKQRVK